MSDYYDNKGIRHRIQSDAERANKRYLANEEFQAKVQIEQAKFQAAQADQLRRQNNLLEEQLRWSKLSGKQKKAELARKKVEDAEENELNEAGERELVALKAYATNRLSLNEKRRNDILKQIGESSVDQAFVQAFEGLTAATLAIRKITPYKSHYSRPHPQMNPPRNLAPPWRLECDGEFKDVPFEKMEDFVFRGLAAGYNLKSARGSSTDFLTEAELLEEWSEADEDQDRENIYSNITYNYNSYDFELSQLQCMAFLSLAVIAEKGALSSSKDREKALKYYQLALIMVLLKDDDQIRSVVEDTERFATDEGVETVDSARLIAEKMWESGDYHSNFRGSLYDKIASLGGLGRGGVGSENQGLDSPSANQEKSKKKSKPTSSERGDKAGEEISDEEHEATLASLASDLDADAEKLVQEEESKEQPKPKGRGGRKPTTKAKAEKEESSDEADDADHALKPIKNKKPKKEESLVRYMILFFFGLFANYLIFGLIASLFGKHYWPF